ncbi:hypothetical protein LINGRAHAP2_LOCUS36409 [Linum grandiflorum]
MPRRSCKLFSRSRLLV